MTGANAGVYSVTATAVCSSSTTTTVAVRAAVAAALSVATTICSGQSANLTVSLISGIGPFTVVVNGTPYSFPASPGTIPVSPASTTTDVISSVTDVFCTRAKGGPGATVTVVQPPVLTLPFGSSSIPLGARSTLTFKLTNPIPSGAPMSGQSFTTVLPSGLTVAPLTTSMCGGTLVASAPGTITFMGGSRLEPKASCSFSVAVTGAAAGVFQRTTSDVACTQGCTGAPARATLSVVGP